MSVLDKRKEEQEKYWQDRAERIIIAGEKTADEMTTGLETAYLEAQRAIQKEIESFYGKYARDVGVSLEEAQRALSRSELKSYQEQTREYYEAIEKTNYAFDPAYRQRLHRQLSLKSAVSRLEALQSDIQWQIENLYAKEQNAFKTGLEAIYEDSYYRAIFNIQQGVGFGSSFTSLSHEAIEKAVKQKWLGGNYSSNIWKDKDRLTIALGQIVPRGIALGQNPRIIGKDITAQLGVRQSYGERLARTEFNRTTNQAAVAGYEEAGVEKYQFIATLDHRTSEFCADYDGEIINLSEMMVGVNFPPLHPNCRSTTIAYFEPDEIDAMFEQSTRIAKGEDGKYYSVSAALSYKNWHNQYVLPQREWNGIIGTATSDGRIIESVKSHFFDQSGTRLVDATQVKDALVNTLHITDVKYNNRSEPSVQYIGRMATVAVNTETNTVITTWQTGTRNRKKYGG